MFIELLTCPDNKPITVNADHIVSIVSVLTFGEHDRSILAMSNGDTIEVYGDRASVTDRIREEEGCF